MKQSVKELSVIFSENEKQLKEARDQLKDANLNIIQKAELNRKISNMVDMSRKKRDIEEEFKNKLIVYFIF